MARRYSRFGDQYRIRIGGRRCVYCGEHATTDEHFPPATYGWHGYILPACAECNALAGVVYPTDFVERSLHVKEKLRSRYHRHLRTPEWSDEELDELGYNLRKGVTAWEKQVKILRERLAWNAVNYIQSIDQCSVFVVDFVKQDFLELTKKINLKKR